MSDVDEGSQQLLQQDHRERGRALTSRANGGLGMVGVSDEKRREIRAVEKRARKAEERDQRRFQWGNNRQNNFQKHYRVCLYCMLTAISSLILITGSFTSVKIRPTSCHVDRRNSFFIGASKLLCL